MGFKSGIKESYFSDVVKISIFKNQNVSKTYYKPKKKKLSLRMLF